MVAVEDISAGYKQFVALKKVGFEVQPASIHGIIGPNGAGKSTLIDVITGSHAPSRGRVVYDGQDVSRLRPFRVARLGLRRTFQHPRLCWEWTVLENVLSGISSSQGSAKERQELAMEALRRVGIVEVAQERSSRTDGVTQLRTQIARCLVARPMVLALDEPSAGMDELQSASLAAMLEGLRRSGVTVLLVAHDLSLIRACTNRVTVLNFGELIADGETDAVLALPSVRSAYMGLAND
jgi:ABC-type branched-subunit amino acid transport system ATPase component